MKLKFLICFLLLSNFSIAQENKFNFKSPSNIKKFADYLFCDNDFLRAALEYERLPGLMRSDSLHFKIGICYIKTRNYFAAMKNFAEVKLTSPYYDAAGLEILKTNFLMGNYDGLKNYFNGNISLKEGKYKTEGKKLFNLSYLFTDEHLPVQDEFVSPFDKIEKRDVLSFYKWKINPPYKSSIVAGVMSAIIPGSGKMYVGEVSDGITALIVTGIFAFLAYDNFNAGHNSRAWIFTSVGALFYGGNVYGSVAAAQVHNAKIKLDYEEAVKRFLEEHNYYSPDYKFCNENK